MAFFRKIEDHVVITLDHGRLILAMIGGFLFVALVFLLGVLVGKTLWSMSADATRAAAQEFVHPVTPEPRPVGNTQYGFYEDVKKPADAGGAQQELKAPEAEDTRAPTPVTPTVPAPPPLPPMKADPPVMNAGATMQNDSSARSASGRETVAMKPPARDAAPTRVETKTARTQVPPTSPPVPKPQPQPAPSRGGGFCVGVESYQDRGKAEAAQRVLSARGVSTEIVPTEVGGAKWYRLQKGGFATREAAEKYRKEVLKPKGFSGYVISR